MTHPTRLAGTVLVALAILLARGFPGIATPQIVQTKLLGKPAPAIEGDFAINGKVLKLSELKGKVVLLDFWEVWCGPSIASFPYLSDWHKRYNDKGLVILGINSYNSEFDKKMTFDKESGKLKKFAKATKESDQQMLMDFAAYHKLAHHLMILSREEILKVQKNYGIQALPTMVLIDRQGIVRWVHVGDINKQNAEGLGAVIRNLLARK